MKKITTLCLSLIVALAGMADEWTLVTDASVLQAGDQIILAYSADNATASTTISTNGSKSAYWIDPVAATFGTNTVTPANSTAIFTIGGSAGAWTLTNQNGQLLGVTAAKKLKWGEGTTTWNISSGGVISSTNATYGQICYNTNPTRFTTYYNPTGNTIKAIQIYKGASTPSVSISYQGFPYRKTACEEPTYKAGSTYTLPTFVPVNEEGKSLKEWSYGDATYAPGATFTVPETDVVFVPVWNGATAIDNAAEAIRATKILRNGQLIIVRGDAEYNAIGTRVK